MDPIKELLTRSVDKIYPSPAELEKALRNNKPLRVYLGVDPTGPHLHLGHATNLLLLRRFQDLGHEIILLIGDFTARIGDPTDKTAARQPLSEEQIQQNLKTFKEQAAKIIHFDGKNPARIEFNSTWHDQLTFRELIKLAQHFTVQQLEERDMFEKRREDKKPIGLHEFLYPLAQGYDSVALDVDIEIGGTDQTFNMLVGRTLMKVIKNKNKYILATKLLLDPATGKKIMNKSEGGLVNLDDTPNEMFGKVMALPDSAIVPLLEFSTLINEEGLVRIREEKNLREAKLTAAHEVVRTYHSSPDADRAREEWIRTFSKKEIPDAAPELITPASTTTVELVALSGLSKSEARRLIEQGGVELNEKKIADPTDALKLKGDEMLRVGKKKFFKIKIR